MNMKTLIRSKNLKFTPSREAILALFAKFARPLSYEDIKEELRMDKATFYRNMTHFEREGIVNGFESSDKKRYYEIAKNPHAHFICTRCHAIECLDDSTLYRLKNHTIENVLLYGCCPKCQV